QGANGRRERAAFRRKRIPAPERRPRQHLTIDDPLRLELAQAHREQPVRDLGDRLGDLGKATGCRQECLDDRAGPALAEKLNGLVEIRTDFLAAGAVETSRLRRRLHAFYAALETGFTSRAVPSRGTSPARVTSAEKSASAT